jgi:hypothetical protein
MRCEGVTHASHPALRSFGVAGREAATVRAGMPKSKLRRGRTERIEKNRRSETAVTVICGKHETFNRCVLDESIHNFGDVRSRNAPVKKVVGFD